MTIRVWQWSIVGGAIYGIAWHLGEQGIVWLHDGAEARLVYGVISAWWLALYVSYVFELRWLHVLPAAITWLAVDLVTYEPVSKLPPLELSTEFVTLRLLNAVFALSPMAVSGLTRFGKERIVSRFGFNAPAK